MGKASALDLAGRGGRVVLMEALTIGADRQGYRGAICKIVSISCVVPEDLLDDGQKTVKFKKRVSRLSQRSLCPLPCSGLCTEAPAQP